MKQFTTSHFRNIPLKKEHCSYIWYEELLDKLYDLFQQVHDYHTSSIFKDKRPLCGMFNLHFPHGFVTQDNSNTKQPDPYQRTFTAFLTEFNKSCNDLGLLYFWVREQELSPHPHYHLFLFISKEKKRSLHRLFVYASCLWCKYLNIPVMRGYVQEGRNHTIDWKQGNNHNNPSYCRAFQHAIYLAKIKEKALTPSNVNLYGHSKKGK